MLTFIASDARARPPRRRSVRPAPTEPAVLVASLTPLAVIALFALEVIAF